MKSSHVSFITYEHFSKTYLLMAKIALLEKERTIHFKKFNKDDRWRLRMLIVIPAIYCIRHGIELFLKSIEVGINKTYSNTHDLDDLKKVINTRCIPLSKSDLFFLIIRKYLNYSFVTKLTTASEKNYDSMNEVFRFPENMKGIKIIGENLEKFKTEELLQDIEVLSNCINIISANWQLNKNANKS